MFLPPKPNVANEIDNFIREKFYRTMIEHEYVKPYECMDEEEEQLFSDYVLNKTT